ncbi:hypothetical protein PBY51_017149 [Eleginops maclovinus]|uniref:Brevican core protein-like n=1 Tax=Eleginops maclovinus TaxID=56733 RepID=A0AAN7XIF5_ELEMC|nr:hypothetical protein PBY51_017149 [Eleginops maclovinus]
MICFPAGYDHTAEPPGVSVGSPRPVDGADGTTSSPSEEAATRHPARPLHPAETPAAETPAAETPAAETPAAELLTDYSSLSATVLNSHPVTSFTSSASVPPSTETTTEHLEEKQEEEVLGGVFLSTTQNILNFFTEKEHDGGEGSGESSGENPEITPSLFLTGPTVAHSEGEEATDAPPPSEVKITLLPRLSLSPGWELEPSPSTLQESRSDLEFSARPPAAEEEEEEEEEEVEEISTSSMHDPGSEGGEGEISTDDPSGKFCTLPPGEEDSGGPAVSREEVTPPLFLGSSAMAASLPDARVSAARPGDAADSCVESPCLNGGTCVDGEPARCFCLPGYRGDFCQTDVEVCEAGWEKFQSFCYRHFGKRQSWEAAEQHCRMCGGHLLSVMTPEEQQHINEKYKEYQWIGLNDRTIEGDFRWSDGNPLLYENWYRGQPDSYFLSGEDCAVMVWHDGGRWSDVPCNYHLSYTCKKSVSSCGEPPKVPGAKVFGKKRSRYETNSRLRFYCEKGFLQKLNPVISCLPGGQWEEPLITCIPAPSKEEDPVTSLPVRREEVTQAMEVQGTVTEKTVRLFWDIKWVG